MNMTEKQAEPTIPGTVVLDSGGSVYQLHDWRRSSYCGDTGLFWFIADNWEGRILWEEMMHPVTVLWTP